MFQNLSFFISLFFLINIYSQDSNDPELNFPVFPICKLVPSSLQNKCFNESMDEHIEKYFYYPDLAIDLQLQSVVNVFFEINNEGSRLDLSGIIETGLDCFCTGLNPNSPYNSGPAKIGFPLDIGGKTVCTGDIIVADADGVTVVPFEQINEVISKLERIVEVENAMDKEVSEGLKISQKALDFINSDQVIYTD